MNEQKAKQIAEDMKNGKSHIQQDNQGINRIYYDSGHYWKERIDQRDRSHQELNPNEVITSLLDFPYATR